MGLIGGALLNIRDAFGMGDWMAELIVGAAKFGAVLGTFLVRRRGEAGWCSLCSRASGCSRMPRLACLLRGRLRCAALHAAALWQGGALMLHYGRRIAIAIDSAFFIVGPLIMAASAGVA